MKDKYEIFQEYYDLKFGKNNSFDLALEYIALSDTIDFQSYLLQYRTKELFSIVGENFMDLLKGMCRGIKYWIDLFIH